MKKKPQKSPILFLIAGGLLLLLAAVLLIAQNGAGQPASPASSAHDEETYPEIPRVSLEDAKAALDAGSAIFVDVRSVEAYAGGHIAGAINIPLADLESRLAEFDSNQWIITYCT